MWIEPYPFLNFGDCGVRLAEADQRHAKLVKRSRVIGRKRDRRIQFDSRFGQSVLQPPKEAKRLPRTCAVCIALDCFEKQLFGSHFISLNRGAPSTGDVAAQGIGKSDLGGDRTRVDLEHTLENSLSLPESRRGNGPIEYGPPADQQIVPVGLECPFLLDTQARRLQDFMIDGARKAASELVLSFCDGCSSGVVPICPQVRATFGIGQLYVYPKQITGPPEASFDDIAHTELASDLLCVNRLVLVGESGTASDYEHSRKPR